MELKKQRLVASSNTRHALLYWTETGRRKTTSCLLIVRFPLIKISCSSLKNAVSILHNSPFYSCPAFWSLPKLSFLSLSCSIPAVSAWIFVTSNWFSPGSLNYCISDCICFWSTGVHFFNFFYTNIHLPDLCTITRYVFDLHFWLPYE